MELVACTGEARNFKEADFPQLARFEAELDAFLVGRDVPFLFRPALPVADFCFLKVLV